MKEITINNNKYELIENYREGFSIDEVKDKLTDYFDEYDYILGDWAYGKVRLKGFFDNSKKKNDTNDYSNIKKYIEEQCAYDCKYFVLKKIIEKK